MIVLSGAALVLPDRVLSPGTLVIDEGRIAEIRSDALSVGHADSPFAFHGHYIVPGFIDVHVHGVEGIDTAMRLGAHHPMGPLELADFIGLDTCLSVMQVLHEGLADSKYRPCPLLVKYVEAGWLGRKTQRGFYDYRGDKPVPTR